MKHIEFDIWEAALLLDTVLRIESGEAKRKEGLQTLSDKLREKALNAGLEIDDSYRNLNGMQYQSARMESALALGVHSIGATPLFNELVSIYRNTPERYKTILKEAEQMATPAKDNEVKFFQWMAQKLTPAQVSEMYMQFGNLKSFISEKGLLGHELTAETDLDTVGKLRSTLIRNAAFNMRKDSRILLKALEYYFEYLKQLEDKRPVTQPPVIPADQHTINLQELRDSKDMDFDRSATPLYVEFLGRRTETISWKALYLAVLGILYNKNRQVLFSLRGTRIESDRLLLWTNEVAFRTMQKPARLMQLDFYAEMALTFEQVVKAMSLAVASCHITPSEFIVGYKATKAEAPIFKFPVPPLHAHVEVKIDLKEARHEFYNWMNTEKRIASQDLQMNYMVLNRTIDPAFIKISNLRSIYSIPSYDELEKLVRRLFQNNEYIEKNKSEKEVLGLYLDFASKYYEKLWKESQKPEPPVDTPPEPPIHRHDPIDVLFDFDKTNPLGFKPDRLTYKSYSYDVKNWQDALGRFGEIAIATSADRFKWLSGLRIADNRVLLGSKGELIDMRKPYKLNDDLLLDTDFEAEEVVHLIRALAKVCQIELGDISVYSKNIACHPAKSDMIQ